MSPRRKIPAYLQQAVRERARYLCEYCHAAETWQYVKFTIEHLIPISQGGEDTLDNLALACFACNRRKWDRRSGMDPETGETQRLFNPRIDDWGDHFVWSRDGLEIVGLTPIGRATVEALELNRPRAIRIRAADLEAGRHPPEGDSRLL